MEFIKEMFLNGKENSLYKPVVVNNTELSIQASPSHYATPRRNVPLNEYTHMEIALFPKDYSFAPIDLVTSDKNIIKEFETHFEGQVFGYVPVESIEKLYQSLKFSK